MSITLSMSHSHPISHIDLTYPCRIISCHHEYGHSSYADDAGPYPEAVSIRARPVRFECEFRGKALVPLASRNPQPSTLNPRIQTLNLNF